jgi:hypothetical protein
VILNETVYSLIKALYPLEHEVLASELTVRMNVRPAGL